MELKNMYGNTSYKILKLILACGEAMPRHFAASDAFLIVEEGKADICFQDRTTPLAQGDTLLIPAGDPHSVTATEDFKAFVVY